MLRDLCQHPHIILFTCVKLSAFSLTQKEARTRRAWGKEPEVSG